MSEPTTPNKALVAPLTGDLVGSWGTTAVNANMSAIDGITGGFATISLSSATTFALTVPAASLTPGAGPTQSQNALLKFTGTLSGNAVVQFAMPGFYIVHNACTVGSFYIQLAPSAGTGNAICAPPGRKTHVFYDGTSMDYVDMPEVGSALDLHQSGTTTPAWILNCTVPPYLLKDGSVYNISAYPQLGAQLGSAYGGNGATTFGVPDELSRVRIPVDTTGAKGRVTTAGSGIDGTTMGSNGGFQSYALSTAQIATTTFTPVGTIPFVLSQIAAGQGAPNVSISVPGGPTAVTNSPITIGSGQAHTSMPPTIVNFLPLIKT